MDPNDKNRKLIILLFCILMMGIFINIAFNSYATYRRAYVREQIKEEHLIINKKLDEINLKFDKVLIKNK